MQCPAVIKTGAPLGAFKIVPLHSNAPKRRRAVAPDSLATTGFVEEHVASRRQLALPVPAPAALALAA
jgi:hypothetical protein